MNSNFIDRARATTTTTTRSTSLIDILAKTTTLTIKDLVHLFESEDNSLENGKIIPETYIIPSRNREMQKYIHLNHNNNVLNSNYSKINFNRNLKIGDLTTNVLVTYSSTVLGDPVSDHYQVITICNTLPSILKCQNRQHFLILHRVIYGISEEKIEDQCIPKPTCVQVDEIDKFNCTASNICVFYPIEHFIDSCHKIKSNTTQIHITCVSLGHLKKYFAQKNRKFDQKIIESKNKNTTPFPVPYFAHSLSSLAVPSMPPPPVPSSKPSSVSDELNPSILVHKKQTESVSSKINVNNLSGSKNNTGTRLTSMILDESVSKNNSVIMITVTIFCSLLAVILVSLIYYRMKIKQLLASSSLNGQNSIRIPTNHHSTTILASSYSQHSFAIPPPPSGFLDNTNNPQFSSSHRNFHQGNNSTHINHSFNIESNSNRNLYDQRREVAVNFLRQHLNSMLIGLNKKIVNFRQNLFELIYNQYNNQTVPASCQQTELYQQQQSTKNTNVSSKAQLRLQQIWATTTSHQTISNEKLSNYSKYLYSNRPTVQQQNQSHHSSINQHLQNLLNQKLKNKHSNKLLSNNSTQNSLTTPTNLTCNENVNAKINASFITNEQTNKRSSISPAEFINNNGSSKWVYNKTSSLSDKSSKSLGDYSDSRGVNRGSKSNIHNINNGSQFNKEDIDSTWNKSSEKKKNFDSLVVSRAKVIRFAEKKFPYDNDSDIDEEDEVDDDDDLINDISDDQLDNTNFEYQDIISESNALKTFSGTRLSNKSTPSVSTNKTTISTTNSTTSSNGLDQQQSFGSFTLSTSSLASNDGTTYYQRTSGGFNFAHMLYDIPEEDFDEETENDTNSNCEGILKI